MRRLFGFLIGFIIMLMSFAALYVTAAIFDAGTRHTIDTYFFQPDNSSARRPGLPEKPSDLGENVMRDMLMRKYVREYFYVIPDEENIARRTQAESPIAIMSAPEVFDAWRQGEAEAIKTLAKNRAMRTVNVIGDIAKRDGSDFWEVRYELKTWHTPNDMNEIPAITRGVMYVSLRIGTEPTKMRADVNVTAALEVESPRPETLFKFEVRRIEMH